MMYKYIAMAPSGVWLVFDEEPVMRISGWSGNIVCQINLPPSDAYFGWGWASTLEAIPLDYYNQFYKEKEL